jgi:hypothetical protein
MIIGCGRRLPRVDCDPDRPGSEVPVTAADLDEPTEPDEI